MQVTFDLDSDGGFTAMHLESGVTAYAYPSSTYASQAKRNPHRAALEMVTAEIEARAAGAVAPRIAADADARNRARLGQLL